MGSRNCAQFVTAIAIGKEWQTKACFTLSPSLIAETANTLSNAVI
jgi:hypothetical protein